MEEIWKSLPKHLNFSSMYQVSNKGRLRNTKTGKIIKGSRYQRYLRVNLYNNKQKNKRTIALHKLVAFTFIGNPPKGKKYVDHINRVRDDNNVKNLRWVSHSENNRNSDRSNSGTKRKVIQLDKNGKFLDTFSSAKKASKKLNLDPSKILSVCKKEQKTSGGYKWMYHEDYFGDLPKEEWKSLSNYNIDGSISNLGRIKYSDGKISVGSLCEQKYYRCALRHNGKHKLFLVHRLVMMAFDPRDEYEEMVVNHIDENKDHNRLCNLEWVTHTQNIQHSLNKQINQYNIDGKFIQMYNSMTEASKKTGCPRRNIGAVCSGTQRSAYNYIWRYADEHEAKDLDIKIVITRKVGQYDKEGNLIKIHDSLTDAAKSMNKPRSNISSACLGKQKTSYGFIWKYED